ncbi:uncharacterized protein LOC108102388 [Drosophila eugracilis]|uniref:uncharacterized protein LOC108102388 n=1 Tax=Drosophila eugracilis TaxID=29029 RepID=UPI0007E86CB8|nr:uncharacterized protein LOC108102388 [Drosophila eugracilis]
MKLRVKMSRRMIPWVVTNTTKVPVAEVCRLILVYREPVHLSELIANFENNMKDNVRYLMSRTVHLAVRAPKGKDETCSRQSIPNCFPRSIQPKKKDKCTITVDKDELMELLGLTDKE